MKKIILISVLCLIGTMTVLSQSNGPLVKVKRAYYLNDKQLNGKELQTILKSEPESAIVFKKAKTNTTVGTAFLGAGTVFILYAAINPPKEDDGPLPGLISDEEMKKWMVPVYISLGCIVTSIPFFVSGSKQFKKSVSIYNSKHTPTGFRNEMKMDIGLTPHGIGVFCRF